MRGEGLGADDEQRALRIGADQRVGQPAAIDVGDEGDLRGARREGPQRLDRHGGPEVGAADADVDDQVEHVAAAGADAAGAHALGEVEHALALGAHRLAQVAPGDDHGPVTVRAQRRVQHRAPLGGIDRHAAEHAVDALAQPELLDQLAEGCEHAFGDPLAGKIEQQSDRAAGEVRVARAIGVEQHAQRLLRQLTAECFQRAPRRAAGTIERRVRHAWTPLMSTGGF